MSTYSPIVHVEICVEKSEKFLLQIIKNIEESKNIVITHSPRIPRELENDIDRTLAILSNIVLEANKALKTIHDLSVKTNNIVFIDDTDLDID